MATTADEPIAKVSEVSSLDAPQDLRAPSPPPVPARGDRSERMRLADTRPRRTRVMIRRVGVWSVFKFSLIFYACVMAVLWLALLLIYLVLQAGGVMDTISEWLGKLSTNTQGTKGYVPVQINGGKIFTALFLAMALLAVVWAVINTFAALMYNLISDLVGGIDITLSEKRR
jgi:Transmembrane domain of unknown function (DUF3566)